MSEFEMVFKMVDGVYAGYSHLSQQECVAEVHAHAVVSGDLCRFLVHGSSNV